MSLVFLYISYLRNEQLSLMSVPFEALVDGRIKWGPIPKWDGTSIVNTVEKKETVEDSKYKLSHLNIS